VDLLKLGVHRRVEPSILEHLGNLTGQLQIRVQIKFGIELWVDPAYLHLISRQLNRYVVVYDNSPSHRLFGRIGVSRHSQRLSRSLPMSTHHDDPLDALLEGLSTDLLPVSGWSGSRLQHGRRAMTEEEYWVGC
jgi:hypothetical protein